jgi:hypothetical protein
MPNIFRELPFFDRFTTLEVQAQAHRVMPLQIVVWVSLGPQGLEEIPDGTPRIPAILDPGFTDGFLMHAHHLRRFCGLQPEHLRRRNTSMRAHDHVIPLHAANLWLHRNVSGERDRFAQVPPFLLELHRGIGIATGDEIYPRLPLLGARALRTAGLQVFIDYTRLRLSVRTRLRFWLFD